MRFTNLAFALILLCCLGAPVCGWGQGENANWVFGDQRRFQPATQTLSTSALTSAEGCASVSGKTGKLLFYSNGKEVWDSTGTVMPNGSGILGNGICIQNGNGCIPGNAAQGVAIVPMPGDSNRYYLFVLEAADEYSTVPQGGYLRYSIVNMSGNGGYGDVEVAHKNVVVTDSMIEFMSVTRGAGCYSWLLLKQRYTRKFQAIKIDAAGIDTPGVFSSGPMDSLVGSLVFSPDGSRVAVAAATLNLYQFNTVTGAVSGGIIIDTLPLRPGGGPYFMAVGFSSDASKLYAGTYPTPVPGGGAGCYQYDVTGYPNAAAIQGTKYPLDTVFWHNPSDFRLDDITGVLYLRSVWFLIGAIQNPNSAGAACNFMLNAVPLPNPGPFLRFGTPVATNRPDTVYKMRVDTTLCFAVPRTFSGPPGFQFYLWKDGTTATSRTITGPDTFWVQCFDGCRYRVDTFRVGAVPLTPLTVAAHDTLLCFPGTYSLAAPAGYSSYIWDNGTTTAARLVSSAGKYWVASLNGCAGRRDTFRVQDQSQITQITSKDTLLCFPGTFTLQAPAGFTGYLWDNGTTTTGRAVSAPGTYWVRYKIGCAPHCDTLHVLPKAIDTTRYKTDTTVCLANQTLTWSAPGGYAVYTWWDGVATASRTFATPGTRWVVSRTGCVARQDTLVLHAQGFDSTRVVHDMALCLSNGATAVLQAPLGWAYRQWDDGSAAAAVAVSTPGMRWVASRTACTVRIDSFRIRHRSVDTVRCGRDLLLCFTDTVQLTGRDGASAVRWSTGATTPTLLWQGAGAAWVQSVLGCTAWVDTFRVRPVEFPYSIGPDTVLCDQSVYRLSAPAVPGATYSWQDGSKKQFFDAAGAGTFWMQVAKDGCTGTDSATVERNAYNGGGLGADLLVCDDDALSLDGGEHLRLWDDGSTARWRMVTRSGDYWAILGDGACTERDTVRVDLVDCNCRPMVPDAFSPNSDGQNDRFQPGFRCALTGYDLKIFNRYGNLVFASTTASEGWDGRFNGTDAELGVYHYLIQYRNPVGSPYLLKGTLTLVR